jgi:hypothetical protein
MRVARLLAAFVGALAAVACEVLVDGELGPVHCTDEGAVGPPACPVGAACVKGDCEPVADLGRNLGSPCASDGDCAADALCLDPAAFGGTGPRTCSRPCCSSLDCGGAHGDVVCWAAPLVSASLCRRAAEVGRGATGAGEAGAPCDDGSACRSGLCERGHCVDGCCSDASCVAAGGSCRVATTLLASAPRWACEAAAGGAPALATCASDADCATRLCVPMLGASRCAAPCCSSATCGELEGAPLACVPVTRGAAAVLACAAVRPKGATLALGDPCSTGDECRSGSCVPMPTGSRVCTDVCCTDASCGGAEFACRPGAPIDAGPAGARAMRCEMK